MTDRTYRRPLWAVLGVSAALIVIGGIYMESKALPSVCTQMSPEIWAETVAGTDWQPVAAPPTATRRLTLTLAPPPGLVAPGDELVARVGTIETAWTVYGGPWPETNQISVLVPGGDAYVEFSFRLFRRAERISCNWSGEETLPPGDASAWSVTLLSGHDEAPAGERRLTRIEPQT